MKEYLQLFRDQVINASFKLFKRLIPSTFIATLILMVLSIIVIMPMMLIANGFGAFSYLDYYKHNQEMQQKMLENIGDMEALMDLYTSQQQTNMSIMLLVFVVAIFFSSWAINFYFKISDNEVRNGSPSIFKSLKESISINIFKIVGASLLMFLLYIAVFIIFGLVFALLVGISKLLGILIGFVGFFVVIIFLLRFMLTIPAIVHGNHSITNAMGYSYKRITWKRGAQMLLIGILFLVALILILFILAAIFGSSINVLDTYSFILIQISNFIFNALFVTYFIAAMTSLYFRYSNDEIDDNIEHLVEENNQG